MSRILIVPDVMNWAWGRRALGIQRYAPDNVVVEVCCEGDVRQHSSADYDTVMFMSWPTAPTNWHPNSWAFVANEGCMHPHDPDSHDFRVRCASSGKNIKTAEQRLPKFRGVITVNPRTVAFLSLLNDRVRYLRTGVDTETFCPLEPINTTRLLRIGWCGKPSIGKRFSPKGYHEVLAPVIKRTNLSVEFTLNTRTSQDALSTAGMVEWYNSIDVLLIVSSCEGTPSIALETMACGRPLIATEVGILPEVIDEAEQLGSGACVEILGQYWSQDGVEAIVREASDAIADAVNDRDRLVSHGHAARQVMCESFSWRQLSELWVNTLLEQ